MTQPTPSHTHTHAQHEEQRSARTGWKTWLGKNFLDALLVRETRADVFERRGVCFCFILGHFCELHAVVVAAAGTLADVVVRE